MGIRSFIRRKVAEKISGATDAPTPVQQAPVRPLPTAPDAEGFVAVARVTDIRSNTGRTVSAHGLSIAVFHIEQQFYAIDDACTHEDAPLGEGDVRGTRVVCPYHDWVYDIPTGACLTDPTRPVGCFETKVHDDFVWVGKRTSDGTTVRGGDHADGLTTSEHAS